MKIKSEDMTSEYVKHMTEKYGWSVNNYKMQVLKSTCQALDNLLEEVEQCYPFKIKNDVNINTHTKQTTVTSEFEYLSIDNLDIKLKNFYTVLLNAQSCSFKQSKTGKLILNFTFDSVWD